MYSVCSRCSMCWCAVRVLCADVQYALMYSVCWCALCADVHYVLMCSMCFLRYVLMYNMCCCTVYADIQYVLTYGMCWCVVCADVQCVLRYSMCGMCWCVLMCGMWWCTVYDDARYVMMYCLCWCAVCAGVQYELMCSMCWCAAWSDVPMCWCAVCADIQYVHHVLVSMYNTGYFCHISVQLTVLYRFSKNTKFHENPSSGSPIVQCGRTDGHDEANSRFSQFCKSALNLVWTRQPPCCQNTYAEQCCHCAGSRFPFWCLSRWNPFSCLPLAGMCAPWRDAPRRWSTPWPSHPLQRRAVHVTPAVLTLSTVQHHQHGVIVLSGNCHLFRTYRWYSAVGWVAHVDAINELTANDSRQLSNKIMTLYCSP